MLNNAQNTKVLVYGNIFRDYRSQTLYKILLDLGCHVSLVCPDFYYTDIEKKTLAVRKIFLLFQVVELFLKAAFADVIYLPPMNTRFIRSAVLAAKIFRKKLVTEIYISIYDTYVNDKKLLKGKQIEPESKQAKDMLKKDVLALTVSDYIIHTTNHELDYWESLFNLQIDSSKVFIAPNCNVSSLVSKKLHNSSEVLEICWWGTFIPLHGLDNIIEALKRLRQRDVQFRCTLFGVDNPLFFKYLEKIQQEQLEEYVFLRKDLSFSDGSLPNYLTDNCDLALGIFGNTDKAYNTVPNKLIEALSMGIPTLTMNSPALNEFFNPEDVWTCEASPESIAEAIVKIAGGEAFPVNWEQTREKVLKTFSVTRYQEVINKVLEEVTEDLSTKNSRSESEELVSHQTI